MQWRSRCQWPVPLQLLGGWQGGDPGSPHFGRTFIKDHRSGYLVLILLSGNWQIWQLATLRFLEKHVSTGSTPFSLSLSMNWISELGGIRMMIIKLGLLHVAGGLVNQCRPVTLAVQRGQWFLVPLFCYASIHRRRPLGFQACIMSMKIYRTASGHSGTTKTLVAQQTSPAGTLPRYFSAVCCFWIFRIQVW